MASFQAWLFSIPWHLRASHLIRRWTQVGFIVGSTEFFVPLTDNVDVEAEIKKLEEELKYAQGFLKSVEGKLSNERFVNGAPAAVVEKERKKKADAEAKIAVIVQQLAGLRK